VPARDFNVAHVGQGLTGDLSQVLTGDNGATVGAVAQEIGHAHHHAPVQHHRQLGPAGGAQALLRFGETRIHNVDTACHGSVGGPKQ